MNKGLSTIVTTIVLIVLSVVAVIIIWGVIGNILQKGVEGVDIEKITFNAQIKNVGIDILSNNATLTVARSAGQGNIVGIKFIFYNGTGSETVTEKITLEELASKRFNFHLIGNVSNFMKISIAPIFKLDEKESVGNIVDTYNIKTGKSEGKTLSCNPVSNPCGTAVCGTAANGTCPGTLNCGTCATGYSCINGGCVSNCTPTTCSALGYNCGTAANGTCPGTLNCGTCGTGYTCASGVCQCNPVSNPCGTAVCGTAANGTCGTVNCGTCATGYTCSGGSCVAGNVIPASSCSYADVSSAINSASSGSTVMVPAGSCTWANSLLITKGINLIGAGVGNTIIKNGGACGVGFQGELWLQYEPSNYALNTPFRLSGFTFDLSNNCGGFAIGQTGKGAPFTVQTNIRIDHNRWINPGGKFIWNAGNMYGVVDHNSFEGSSYTFKNDPQASYDWFSNSPQNIFVSGANNYLYYEDNTIVMGGSGDNLLAECQYGGRYAFRYNTITNPIPSYSLFEMHGHQSSGAMPSCFGAEVYGNLINAGSNQITLFKVRGGRSFIFDNSVNAGSLDNVAYTSLVTCPASNPAEQMIHDTYWWGSRKGLTGSLSTASASGGITCAGRSGIPMLGRDVVADNTSPGVSCGTLANRPATCTINQGYWATDQSCTSLAGMVGANPSAPISGTLYKCTALNTWEAFYAPYTYPHPLTLAN